MGGISPPGAPPQDPPGAADPASRAPPARPPGPPSAASARANQERLGDAEETHGGFWREGTASPATRIAPPGPAPAPSPERLWPLRAPGLLLLPPPLLLLKPLVLLLLLPPPPPLAFLRGAIARTAGAGEGCGTPSVRRETWGREGRCWRGGWGAAAGSGRGSGSSPCASAPPAAPTRAFHLVRGARARASPAANLWLPPEARARLARPLGHAPSRLSPASSRHRGGAEDEWRDSGPITRAFMKGLELGCSSPPAADLGLFWHHAAAREREPPATLQSVPSLWNVANVEPERALASVGGPRTVGMGRGAGAGPADPCAALDRARSLLVLFTGNFVHVPLPCTHEHQGMQPCFLRERCVSCRY